MLEIWLHICRVKIMFALLLTKFIHFHNNKFDEMLCKLNFTENPRSFFLGVRQEIPNSTFSGPEPLESRESLS